MPPFSPDAPSPADVAACRAAIRDGSKSFHAASLLLPTGLRDASAAIYAFCRLSDDAVDLHGGDLSAVARLRGRLDRIYLGAPDGHAADRALASVVAVHGLPRAALDALLEGLAWDAEGRRYATLSELRAYAARVAGSVGAMMAALLDARTPAMAARACDLGAAMQLTNIARDIGEDARNGRIYLPLEWLDEAGVDAEAFLADPQPTAAVRGLTRRLLAEADALYTRAEPGVARLPAAARPAIWAARRIYAEIGVEIARNGFDSVTKRAVTSKARKIALIGRALRDATMGAAAARAGLSDDAQAEALFLVRAVSTSSRAVARRSERDGWPLDQTVERMLAITDKLNRRDRERGLR